MTSRVAVLRVTPDNIFSDIDRLVDLAGVGAALSPGRTTILKDNISWHFPFPGANTTPWQLEGTVRSLRSRGFDDLVCVQNKTVVTDAFKGEDLNGYLPIFKRYDVPVRYNFKPEDMTWSVYRPKAKMNVLDQIFPEGIQIPDAFHGTNIIQLPTVKCHIYTTTTGAMKNAFGGLLNTRRHYTHSWIHETLVDLLAIQKEIHPGLFAIMDGTTAGNGPGPRTMYPVVKNVMLASSDQVAIDAVAAKLDTPRQILERDNQRGSRCDPTRTGEREQAHLRLLHDRVDGHQPVEQRFQFVEPQRVLRVALGARRFFVHLEEQAVHSGADARACQRFDVFGLSCRHAVAAARQLATDTGATVLLKGPTTVVASPASVNRINTVVASATCPANPAVAAPDRCSASAASAYPSAVDRSPAAVVDRMPGPVHVPP